LVKIKHDKWRKRSEAVNIQKHSMGIFAGQFKDSTVRLMMNNNKPMIKIAEDLGVYIKTLYAWVRAYKKNIISRLVIADEQRGAQAKRSLMKRMHAYARKISY